MGKTEKDAEKEVLSKVYREFSRQKYNKYKLQFPKMRESQIVSKIIKEWDALDLVAKKSLQKAYEEKNFLTSEDISSSEALMRAEQARKDALSASKNVSLSTLIKTERPAPTRIIPAESHPKSDSDYNRDGPEHVDSKIDSSSPALIVQRFAQKGTQEKLSYIQFFKFYFEKLNREHRRWTSTQISTVIKLMWKKRKNLLKTKKIQKTEEGRIRKIISGRRFFRRERELSAQDSRALWKRFTIETRNFWEIKAKRLHQTADLNIVRRRILHSRVPIRLASIFNILKMPIAN